MLILILLIINMIYACTFIDFFFGNVNMLSFYFCKQEYKIAMVNNPNKNSSTRLISTRKNNVTYYSQNDIPDNVWCNNCRDSSNIGHRRKVKSCLKPWLINLNDCFRKEKRLLSFIDSPK